MEALAGAGNVAEALRVYDDLRVLLRDELGTAPAAELQALHQRLLAGEGARSARSPAEPPPVALPAPARAARALGVRGPRPRAGRCCAPRGTQARGGPPRLVVRRAASRASARRAWRRSSPTSAQAGRHRALRRLPGGGARRLPAVRGGAARRRARLGAGRRDARRGRARARDPRAARRRRRAGAGDAELQRYLLFEAIVVAAGRASPARAPLALVLDDLHWADRGTLHLLRHVARAPREAPLLIVGTLPRRGGPPVAPARGAAGRPAPRPAGRARHARGPGRARRRRADRRARRARGARRRSSGPSTSTRTATRSSSRRCSAT